MSLLAVKNIFSKIYIFMKEYWQIPFLITWSVIVWVFARRNTQAIVDVMEAKKESYNKQIEVLRWSHNEEILKRDGLIKRYEEELSKLRSHFEREEEELTEKHKSDLKKVVVETRKTPEKIKERIEKEFGFKYVE